MKTNNKLPKMNIQLHGSMNPDLANQKKNEIMQRMNAAIKEGNEEAFAEIFVEFTENLQQSVLDEAKGMLQATDTNVLVGRGVRQLTSEENTYYQKVIDAMKSSNPKQSLTLINETLPKTVIESVFEDIIENHPLLDAINFQNTGILTEILVSTLDGRFMATWGKLCDTIVTELTAGTSAIKLNLKKLSAFIPICKAMLEIGPVWIDKYVRTILAESTANGLEAAIIDGDGLDEPIGMRRNPNGALDPQDGYPLTALIPLAEINPASYGGLLANLAVGPNGLTRTITEILFIVNPVDYFTRLMPTTTVMVNGVWVNDIFPFPTKVIQSVHAPIGEAVVGIAKRYFFGLGTGKGGNIEYSDHYKFLEDDRYYLTKLYGDGKPLDEVSFKRLDLTNLRPTTPIIRVKDFYDANLKSIVVAGGTLSPAFNENVTYYTADDVIAAGKFTVAANDATATIAITVNGVAGTNDAKVTWEEGANTVIVTVTKEDTVKTYVVVVTYTAA